MSLTVNIDADQTQLPFSRAYLLCISYVNNNTGHALRKYLKTEIRTCGVRQARVAGMGTGCEGPGLLARIFSQLRNRLISIIWDPGDLIKFIHLHLPNQTNKHHTVTAPDRSTNPIKDGTLKR